MGKPRIRLFAALGCLFFVHLTGKAQTSPARLDDSDWWSTLVKFNQLDLSAPSTNTQNGQPAPSNFEIAGIVLSKQQFQNAAAKLGKAPVVERGDAANHRIQVCYSSLDKSQSVHLVFERDGEGFDSSFYLFEDGSPWNGIDLCVGSAPISAQLHTGSALRLGETQAQVRSILGKPSTSSPSKLTYVYEVRRKTSAQKLGEMRRAYPNLQDQELHSSFDFYYAHVFIEARFVHSRLTYLAVTRSETFP
jgi:SmpA/OmlA family protein